MKVFLSWSGERSRLMATALHEWLPQVINAVEPFISSNIDAGARWQSDVADELEKTDFGVLCVTAENQQASWLNFEAGALAKKVGASRVVPLAINLRPVEIQLPLAQFQAQPLTLVGMGKIVVTINSFLSKPLPDAHVEKAMRMWWPELESKIQKMEQQEIYQGVAKEPVRSDRELLEDVLNTVRGLARYPGDTVINIQPSRTTSNLVREKGCRRVIAEAIDVIESIEPRGAVHEKLIGRFRTMLSDSEEPPAPDKSSDE